jgi:hypothetical protein
MAATDPDRAAQLIAEAERLARSITEEEPRDFALAGVARAIAATDPDRAEHLAQSISCYEIKGWVFAAAARAVAATDPDRAERLTESVYEKDQRASTLAEVAAAMVATDPSAPPGSSPKLNASPSRPTTSKT